MSNKVVDPEQLLSLARRLDELESRAAIAEILARYCHALDSRDERLLRSCFHPHSKHDHGFVGSSTDFCTFAIDWLKGLPATQHLIGSISIAIKDDQASVRTYYRAYHRMPAAGEMPMEGANPNDEVIIGGRYMDRFQRVNDEWRIAARKGTEDYWLFQPAADRGQFSPSRAADWKWPDV